VATQSVYHPGSYETVDGKRRWLSGRWVEAPDGATMLKSGVSAIVSRLTCDEVVERMAQVAAKDEAYQRQLEELAEAQGGVYADALVLLGETGSSIENRTTE
jgi:hypothetical protein